MLGTQGDIHIQDNPFLSSDSSPHTLLSNTSSSPQGQTNDVNGDCPRSLPETLLPDPHHSRVPTSSTSHLDDPPLWPADSAILVAVRVRPFNEKERANLAQAPTGRFNLSTEGSLSANYHAYVEPTFLSSGGKQGSKSPTIRKVVNALDERVLVFDPPDPESISKYKRGILPVQAYRKFKDMRYAFDRVFHEDAQQEEVFRNTTRHLIDGVLGGYNGTLFAYGATGCGKTHTISGTPEKPGIIYLTMQELYERIKDLEDEKTFEVSVSYLEVYNETLRDLLIEPLAEGAKPVALHMREDANKRISITGLSEHHPKGMDEVMALISRGNNNRTMSPTEANATSSRSHAVLQINICQRLKTANVNEDFTMATLSLIDLAGSERASATRNRGERMLEGANINKSLLALGNCINALCDHRRDKTHIPYRDSKLTRLLKFSLGGNCKTVMIACVSPSSQHYEETHNTLKYANRAKNITTKVTKNTLNVDRHVSEYVQAIYELRQEVGDLKAKLQRQTGQESLEKTRLQQEAYRRELEDMIYKVRATFQTARDEEMGYAQLQARVFVLTERLSTLYHWRAGFDEAKTKASERRDQIELELASQVDTNNPQSSAAVASTVASLNSSISKASSYISVVDDLIERLNACIIELSSKMQDQEDALKMYAVSIQNMERQANLAKMGFPFEHLYELEKKSQALESHNKILATKLELSDQALSEQFGSLKEFMALNVRSLVGLRPEIDLAEEQGKPTVMLNDVYMSAISSFSDMTRRIQSLLPEQAMATMLDPAPTSTPSAGGQFTSPRKRTIGLKGSRMMSILPDVPQTPIKKQRYTTSNILPHISMDTVDTSVALGTSSLFGDQSPIRLFSGGDIGDAPPVNSPSHNRIVTTPRKKPSPLPGVIFSPVRKRVRGGLRQPRSAPTPTKRNVNFSLDVVEEDDERLTTGIRDPSMTLVLPPARSLPQLLREAAANGNTTSLSSSPSVVDHPVTSAGTSTSHTRPVIPSTPRFAAGLSGGARRVATPTLSEAGGGGAARRVVHAARSELSKGAQRVVASASSRSGVGSTPSSSSMSSPFSNYVTSPIKRARQLSNAAAGHDAERGNGKRMKATSPSSSMTSVHRASASRYVSVGGLGSPEQQHQHQNQNQQQPMTHQGQWSSAGNASPSAVDVEMRDGVDGQHHDATTTLSPSSKDQAQASVSLPLLPSGLSPPTSRLASMSFSVRLPTLPVSTGGSTTAATSTTSTINKSMATKTSFAAATLSSASRRRSLGGALLMRGSAARTTSVAGSSGSSRGEGGAGGGGPIRDVTLRRKLRASNPSSTMTPPTLASGAKGATTPYITPPKEIPTYQQILQRRTGGPLGASAGDVSRRLSFRPVGKLSPLRGGGGGGGRAASTSGIATGTHPRTATTTGSGDTTTLEGDGKSTMDHPSVTATTQQQQQTSPTATALSNISASSRRKSGLPVPIKQSTPTASNNTSTLSSSSSPSLSLSLSLPMTHSDGEVSETATTASTLSAMMADESAWEDLEQNDEDTSARRRKSLPAHHRVSARLTLEEIESVYDKAKERASRRRSMLPT